LGYSQPDNDRILLRKGMPNKLAKIVKAHEFEHIQNGEEGPFAWGAVLGGLASGLLGSHSSRKASSAQQRAAKEANELQKYMYDTTREDYAPYREHGYDSLGRLSALNNGDFSGFYESPDYQFALQEGEKGTNRLAAATGRLGAGSHFKDMARFNQGLASQNYGNFYNRLAAGAGIGQTATNSTANAGQNYAANSGNLTMQAGNARASGYLGQGNAWGNALNQAMYGMGQGSGSTGAFSNQNLYGSNAPPSFTMPTFNPYGGPG